MANSTPQFTPAQILEAGQRAESDGRIDHAIQFYRHLVDHYLREPEAALARDGLQRLERTNGYVGAPPKRDPAETPRSSEMTRRTKPPLLNGAQARPVSAPATGARSPQPPAPSFETPPPDVPAAADDRTRMQIAPAAYDPGETVWADEVGPMRRSYGFGRFLARVMTFLGIFLLLAGLALIAVIVIVPAAQYDASGIPALVAVALGYLGPGLLFTGLVICLIGQIARAVFDTADATRHAAAVARSQRPLK